MWYQLILWNVNNLSDFTLKMKSWCEITARTSFECLMYVQRTYVRSISCDLFHLTNIVKSGSCLTKTNKPSSFNKTLVSETGLSDYHKIIATFSKWHFSRPKVITYRNYKKFHKEKFLNDQEETNTIIDEKYSNQNYQSLTKTFLTFVNKHGLLKKRIVRGNQDPFMTEEFHKAIYTRSRLKNKMSKNPTILNIAANKKPRNLWNFSLRRKNKIFPQ